MSVPQSIIQTFKARIVVITSIGGIEAERSGTEESSSDLNNSFFFFAACDTPVRKELWQFDILYVDTVNVLSTSKV